jgi:hypothetical protein
LLKLDKVPACRAIEGDPKNKTLLMDLDLQENDTFKKFVEDEHLKCETVPIELGYDNFDYQEVLRAVLP